MDRLKLGLHRIDSILCFISISWDFYKLQIGLSNSLSISSNFFEMIFLMYALIRFEIIKK